MATEAGIDWKAVHDRIVASVRADLLIGQETPGWTPGDFFLHGVTRSVRLGIKSYFDNDHSKEEARNVPAFIQDAT